MLTLTKKIIVPQMARPAPQHGSGIVHGNPARCLLCRKKIKAGDKWVKHTSPTDPELGTYSFIVHMDCVPENDK